MPDAAPPEAATGDEDEPPVWPFSSYLLFLVWLGLMASVTVSLGFFFFAGDVPTGLVVADAVLVGVLVAAGLGHRESSEPLQRCDACRHAQEPTRCDARGRLWTCFACGHEVSRLRTTQQSVARPQKSSR